jgi:hypothetical protein
MPAAALAFAVILAVGCNNDEGPNSTSTPTQQGSAVPTQAANADAIQAAHTYLTEEGVEGKKGGLTDPLNCVGVSKDSPGRFCVHDAFTTYAPGLVILRIGEKEKPDERVWEVRLQPGGEGWQVTSAEPFGLSE